MLQTADWNTAPLSDLLLHTGTLTHLGAGCHYIGYNEPGVMGPLIIISDAVSPSPHQSRSQSEAAGTH